MEHSLSLRSHALNNPHPRDLGYTVSLFLVARHRRAPYRWIVHIHGWIQSLSLLQLPLAGIAVALGFEQWAAARGSSNRSGQWIALAAYLAAFVLSTNFLLLNLWGGTEVGLLAQLRAIGNGALFLAAIPLVLSTLDRVTPALRAGAIVAAAMIVARTAVFLFTDWLYRHQVVRGYPEYTPWLGRTAVLVLVPIAIGIVVIALRSRSSRERLLLLAGIGGSVAVTAIGVVAAPPSTRSPALSELLAGLLALPMLGGLVAVARIGDRRSWRVLQRLNREQAALAQLLKGSLDLAGLARYTVDLELHTITLSSELAAMHRLGDEEVTYGIDEYRRRFVPPEGGEHVSRPIEAADAGGTTLVTEGRLIRDDGTTMWHRTWSMAVDGTTRHGVVQDITAQKLAEIELRETATTLKTALDLAELATYEVDSKQNATRISAELSSMLGLGDNAVEVPTDTFRERFVYTADQEQAAAAEAAYAAGHPLSVESRFVRADGEIRWLRARRLPADGDISFGVAQDITEYKRREADLRESAATLKAALAVVQLATYEIDVERRTIRLSAEMSAMHGAGEVELEMPLAAYRERFHHPDEAAVAKLADAAYARQTPLHFESRIVRDDGETRWIRTRSVPTGDDIIHGVIQDITAEKVAEIELRESAATLRAALSLAGLATYEVDAKRMVSRLSPELSSMFGLGDEALEMSTHELRRLLYAPEDFAAGASAADAAYAAPGPVTHEGRVTRADGTVLWYRARSEPVGENTVRGVAQDITQQKLAEIELRDAAAALAESEERFRRLAENSPDVVIRLVGPERRTEYVSPAVERILHRTPEDFYADSRAFEKMLDPLDFPARASLFASPEPREAILRVHPEPGTTVWLDVRIVPVFEGDVVVAHEGTIRDVSDTIAAQHALEDAFERLQAIDAERRELLEHLLRAQEEERRLIAQGIHDDSVQELVANAMRLERLAGRLADPAVKAELEELATTARGVISRLRTLLFELDPPILRREGLRAALHESLLLFGEEIEAQVEFDAEVTAEPTPERASLAFRITQEAFANIRKHANASHVAVQLFADGSVVRVRVSDDGEGFDVEALTPVPGHMGLASIERRAKIVGGWSRVESAPGIGTVVEVELPAEAL